MNVVESEKNVSDPFECTADPYDTSTELLVNVANPLIIDSLRLEYVSEPFAFVDKTIGKFEKQFNALEQLSGNTTAVLPLQLFSTIELFGKTMGLILDSFEIDCGIVKTAATFAYTIESLGYNVETSG